MLVTSGVRFISKDFLVFALVEYAAFRVCSRNSLFYHFRFTGVISTAGIIPVVVFVEGFLSVRFSVLVYLIKQFVCIALCFFGYSFASLPVITIMCVVAAFQLEPAARNMMLYVTFLYTLMPILVGNAVSWTLYFKLYKKPMPRRL